MLKEQKPIVVEMPITSDIRTFLHFLSGEIQKYVSELCQDKTLEIWIILSKKYHCKYHSNRILIMHCEFDTNY